MKQNFRQCAPLLGVGLILAGCQGEESPKAPASNTLMAYNTVVVANEGWVDISQAVAHSGRSEVQLTNVTSIMADCPDAQLGDALRFQVAPSDWARCEYQYQVSAGNERSGAQVQVMADDDHVVLTPLTTSLPLGGVSQLGVPREGPQGQDLAGFALSANLSTVGPGCEEVTLSVLNSTWPRLVFNGAQTTSACQVTATYQLTLDGEPLYWGVANAAVTTSTHTPPQAGNSAYPDALPISETAQRIDITPYVQAGTYPDWQLLEVQSLTANVAVDDKQHLLFSASQEGVHTLGYTVGDEYGGLSVGLLTVEAYSPDSVAPWSDILTADAQFLAPLTHAQAQRLGVVSESQLDISTGSEVVVSGQAYSVAQGHCSTLGFDIPTVAMLDDVRTNGHAVAEGWPHSQRYWAKVEGDNQPAGVYELADGSFTHNVRPFEAHYVTCAKGLALSIVGPESLIAGRGSALTVRLFPPRVGDVILRLSGDDATFEANGSDTMNVSLNPQGEATARVVSNKAMPFTLSASMGTFESSERFEVAPDRDNAVVTLEVQEDGALVYDGENVVRARLADPFGNRIGQETLPMPTFDTPMVSCISCFDDTGRTTTSAGYLDLTLVSYDKSSHPTLMTQCYRDACDDVTVQFADRLYLDNVMRVVGGTTAFAALRQDGVVSWGDIRYESATQAVPAPPDTTISDIAQAYAMTAVLWSDGSVSSWGQGHPAEGPITTPPTIADPASDAEQVVALVGSLYAFGAIQQNGEVVAWGHSGYGGLMNSTLVDVRTAVPNTYAFAVTMGDDAALGAWGNVSYGGRVPAEVVDVKAITPSYGAFAAIAGEERQLVTWGHEGHGGLGPSLTGVKEVVSTHNAFAALLEDDTVQVWGDADRGGRLDANEQAALSEVVSITANTFAFAALKEDGSVVAWGGAGTGGGQVPSFEGLSAKAVYSVVNGAFAALLDDNTLRVWGRKDYGGNPDAAPAQAISRLWGGNYAFVAELEDGSWHAWGNYSYGGHLPNAVKETLRQSTITEVVSNAYGFAALTDNGRVVTWGSGNYGGNSCQAQPPWDREGYSAWSC
ncbi:hypothetical protein [Vibrio sp. WXL103]|uniref:hypothetical protein n=1 Tax=Vibrio sp. WXL103 TaxID=3450710 RepID=UPI003EC85E56